MPVTFDTYDNCSFQCVYCFSFFQRAIGQGKDDYLHHVVHAVDVEKVKRLFLGQIPKSQFSWYLQQRKVIQWGGLSDGFDYYERKFRKSLELLRFFNSIDYPVSISTKGVWWTEDPEYVEAFRDARNVHLKSSIISLDEEKVHKVERGVASSEDRFRMLEFANKIGVACTTVRYRPFILGISADYPFTPRSKQQIEAFVHRTKEAGCYSLTTEFLCLESRASNTARERYEIISKIAGFPMFEFYRRYSMIRSGLLRLNYDLKRPYIEAMQEACDKYAVKFFVSDAHHKEKSYHAGCCGLPETGPLSNTNRGQYAEAILIAKRNGRVRWSDIAELAEGLKNIPFYAAEGFNQGGTDERVRRMYQSMWDYMRDVWNNPKSGMSPARYFGGALVPAAPDEAGDVVYLYNEPFVERAQRVGSVQELALHLVKQGYAMQEDGAAWGHVAYDVVLDASRAAEKAEALLAEMNKYRLQPKVYVAPGTAEAWAERYPSLDFLELPPPAMTGPEAARALIQREWALLGVERIWLLVADDWPQVLAVRGEDGKDGEALGLRAWLSAAEAEFTEHPMFFSHKWDGREEPAGGRFAGLLECAQYTAEQREGVM